MARIVRRTLIGLALFALALAAAGGLVYRVAAHQPEFYRQAGQTAPTRQQRASNELLEHVGALASNVRKNEPWSAVVTAEQLNGWLAVDLMRHHPRLIPPEFREPRVAIATDGVHVGCRYGRLGTVVWIDADLYLTEPNVVALRLRRMRAGLLPVPLHVVLDGISDAAKRTDARLRWQQAGGDPVALIELPRQATRSDRVMRIERLELRPGEVFLSGRSESADTATAAVAGRNGGSHDGAKR